MISDIIGVSVYRETFLFITIYCWIILYAIQGRKYCDDVEKRIYSTGMFLSLGSFGATFLLSNLDFLSVIEYLILAVMVSFIPLQKCLKRNINSTNKVLKNGVIIIFCAAIIFRRGVLFENLYAYVETNLLDIGGIIKVGPAKGIITDYMGAYEANCSLEDWKSYVEPGDRVVVVADYLLNPLVYLYQDVTISIHSTISTPTYSDMLAKYWDYNPQKKPDVIVVRCWYGNLYEVNPNNWIFSWMEQQDNTWTFEDGKYWRFYRSEE